MPLNAQHPVCGTLQTIQMNIRDKILPPDEKKRKWISIGLTAAISGLLTVWGIYGIGEYGIALFILTPLFIGAGSTILYGYKNEISKREALQVSFLTLGVLTIGLLIFAVEGLICVAMAAPIGLLLTWLGGLIGFSIIKKNPNNSLNILFFLIGVIPTMAFLKRIVNQL